MAVTQPGQLQRGGAALTFLISHETRMLNVFPSADNYGLSKLAVKPPRGEMEKKKPHRDSAECKTPRGPPVEEEEEEAEGEEEGEDGERKKSAFSQ